MRGRKIGEGSERCFPQLESLLKNFSQVQSMEALEDSVLNLTHTRTTNRLRKHSRITFNFLSGTAVMWRRPECLFLPKLEADNTR